MKLTVCFKRKTICTIIFVILSMNIMAQKDEENDMTDNQIAKSLLGIEYYQINDKLNTLGVWYKMHMINNIKIVEQEVKVYSIESSNGTVKLYKMELKGGKVSVVIVNYRHDNKQHIVDMMESIDHDDSHVGVYSTDLIYKYK